MSSKISKRHIKIANSWLESDQAALLGYKVNYVDECAAGEFICWGCGCELPTHGSLQITHIVPKTLGGSDDHLNLMLLCDSCHREAPDCTNPKYMISWVKDRQTYAQKFFEISFPIMQTTLKEPTVVSYIHAFGEDDFKDIFNQELEYVISTSVQTHGSTLVWSTKQAAMSMAAEGAIIKAKEKLSKLKAQVT